MICSRWVFFLPVDSVLALSLAELAATVPSTAGTSHQSLLFIPSLGVLPDLSRKLLGELVPIVYKGLKATA